MHRLVIIGGKLQGTEAAVLAGYGGIKTLLVDRNPRALASGLADDFLCLDVVKEKEELLEILRRGDILLPAMENEEVLTLLESLLNELDRKGVLVAFDFHAYKISSSKIKSDQLFRRLNLPVPQYYPQGGFPFIGKPDRGSGSQGVQIFRDQRELEACYSTRPKGEWIFQEFLQGLSYSIEVTGAPGAYKTHAITQIHMDAEFDCRKVTAPCSLDQEKVETFRAMAENLAEELQLKGIMDLEVIDCGGKMKLLEIDARIPSQTPLAVYHSSGANLLCELISAFYPEPHKANRIMGPDQEGGSPLFVAYEHYLVADQGVFSLGEHIMGSAGPLRLENGKFGSDVVLSDYERGKKEWRGIFINASHSLEGLEMKRTRLGRELENLYAMEHSEGMKQL